MEAENSPTTAKELIGYLIMNADDYGPSEEINQGVIKGILEGVINSVSVLVTFQDPEIGSDQQQQLDLLMTAIKQAESRGCKVEVGLHLSLNAGKPVTQEIESIPKLLVKRRRKRGYFKSLNAININREYIDQAGIEMKNQLAYLQSYLKRHGKQVDHINHHVGFVTFHEGLWSRFIEIAAEEGIAVRSPIGYMSTAKFFYKTGLFSGVTAEGIKKTFEKWFSNLLFFSPHRNITDAPFRMLLSRKKLMKERYNYARDCGVYMPEVFNDNYYDEASRKKAINFLQSFDDLEIKEFMLHPLELNKSKKIETPHGFKKRAMKRRHHELRILLESFFKRSRTSQTKLVEIIKGNATITNLNKQEIRLKLINYSDLAKYHK